MEICGFEKFSMVDWDGKIVCTVFTKGCDFCCPFCHNASLALGDADSIEEEEVSEYLRSRKGLVDGVCVSGGEPTLQPDLAEFCLRVKEGGYAVKLDTNGTRPSVVKNLIENGLVDYVAMDVKNSPSKYAVTAGLKGIDLAPVQESVNFLKNCGLPFEFRTTVISEFHTAQDMKIIAEWIDGADAYFIQKYVDREGCISHGFTEVPKETAEEWLSFFDVKVKKTGLRGY